MPGSATVCPHCGRPSLYPNIRAAEEPAEVAALEKRYRLAESDARRRGAGAALHDFERAINGTVAILARSSNELLRLATGDDEIYATFYQLIGAGVKSHTMDEWSLLRAIADEALFSGYKQNIRFAALSLDNLGLSNYGECSVLLRDDMIAHRASVFEENSTMFMEHHKIRMSAAYKLPLGYRAKWDDRGKLCVAKLSKKIDASTLIGAYSELLLRQGATTADDDFVEVHICGPMTARTFEQVTITQGSKSAKRVIAKALKEKFDKAHISVTVKVR